jgi:hypothetical protein
MAIDLDSLLKEFLGLISSKKQTPTPMAKQEDIYSRLLRQYTGYTKPSDKIHDPLLDKPIPASSGSSIASKAAADLGVKEDLGKNDGRRIREYFKHLNAPSGQEWCAAAVSAWLKEGGFTKIPGSLSARQIGRQFQSINSWVSKENLTDAHLVPGNVPVWARGKNTAFGHVGIIYSYNGSGKFTSIEGNSGPRGDIVAANSHSINDANLLGIGIVNMPIQASAVEELADKFYKLAIKQ